MTLLQIPKGNELYYSYSEMLADERIDIDMFL